MDSEAQTPAVARLERAIESLETALVGRRQTDDAAGSANLGNDTHYHDLSRRHDALKSAVATCLGEIDTLLADGGRTDA